MGNLLGAPVTEKETHTGTTDDGMEYGVSSMQGWRVHMEDAHITEAKLYAMELLPAAAATAAAAASTTSSTTENDRGQLQPHLIDLEGHSLYAVFDGHGGTFAAAYSGRNLCRVLSRQTKFVQYAKFELERKTKTFRTEDEMNEYLQTGVNLLKEALCDAFVELDKEIACALKGQPVADADQGYLQFYNDQKGIIMQSTTTSADAAANSNNSSTGSNAAAAVAAGGDAPSPPEDVADKEHVGGASSAAPATAAALRLLEEEGDSGTTACMVLLTPLWVVCANAGDSRAVICRAGGKAVPLSYDHKPDDESEERRIRAAGGYVAGGRVEGDLAVSRGLGDYRFKNMAVVLSASLFGDASEESSSDDNNIIIGTGEEGKDDPQPQQRSNSVKPGDQKVSPIPDIIVQKRNEAHDEFLIVACDGIWDVQTNYEAVKTVADMFQEGETNMGLICEEFCDICLRMGSKDNMTALVVKLPAQKVGSGGGVTARRQLREAETNTEEKPPPPNNTT